jgi:hypothetical protein
MKQTDDEDKWQQLIGWKHPDPERDAEIRADLVALTRRREEDSSIDRRYCRALLDTLMEEASNGTATQSAIDTRIAS